MPRIAEATGTLELVPSNLQLIMVLMAQLDTAPIDLPGPAHSSIKHHHHTRAISAIPNSIPKPQTLPFQCWMALCQGSPCVQLLGTGTEL